MTVPLSDTYLGLSLGIEASWCAMTFLSSKPTNELTKDRQIDSSDSQNKDKSAPRLGQQCSQTCASSSDCFSSWKELISQVKTLPETSLLAEQHRWVNH